jgi:hypothetical protein
MPPINPLTTSTSACLPPFSPATNISVVAVASGKGIFHAFQKQNTF